MPATKGARAQDRKGREPTPGRSRHLHDAIRERFPNFREFDAWNERHASRDSRFLITPQLFIDIDRGHTPTLHHLYALSSASGWPLERVCREFDVDYRLTYLDQGYEGVLTNFLLQRIKRTKGGRR